MEFKIKRYKFNVDEKSIKSNDDLVRLIKSHKYDLDDKLIIEKVKSLKLNYGTKSDKPKVKLAESEKPKREDDNGGDTEK